MEGSRRRALLKSAKVKAIVIPPLVAGPVGVALSDATWITMAVFAFYFLLAILLDSRIIFCTLLGLFFGELADPAVKGGGIVFQVWETAGNWLFGTAVGIAIGFALEAARRDGARFKPRTIEVSRGSGTLVP